MFGIRRMLKENGPGKELLVMLTCFTLVFTAVMPVAAAGNMAQTEMKHSPPGYFVPEHRIQLDASVKDAAGVNVVRCYFKAAGEADFVFVPMTKTGGDNWGNLYSGILPAPSTATEQIEYLFLTVNAENNIVKSQNFTINRGKKDEVPAWQNITGKEEIQVSMELDKVPSSLPGFTDNIAMNQVESGLRFGVVAGGLYYLNIDKTSHTSGAASSATSSGTVTAKAAGFSTAFLVGAGVAGAAAVGGAAIAIGGGGGGGGGGGSHGGDTGSDLPGGTGDVKATLQWSGCNDLDLHVTDPCGNTISFLSRSATCAGQLGQLDVDANAGACVASPAENIYWETAPRGSYTVAVTYYSGSGSSSYTVTTIVGGVRQTFTGSISGGTTTITSFTY